MISQPHQWSELSNAANAVIVTIFHKISTTLECLLIFSFRHYFRLSENNFNDDDSNEEDEEWVQRRYSLQLNEARGYRRNKAKESAQPRLDSEDENEQPSELLSRQNTM